MKDPKTLITSAAGLLVVGIGTWLITTTADGTIEMAGVEKDIETLQTQVEELESDVSKLQTAVYDLKNQAHTHDKKGNVVE